MKQIRKILSLLLALVIMLGSVSATASAAEPAQRTTALQDLVQYVNPLTGSDNYNIEGTNKSKFAGLAPFVMAPFAMTNFTPQTQENKIGQISYEYWNRGNIVSTETKEQIKISGFFASHQPAIWMGDYGYMNVMPQVGSQIKPAYLDRRLSYSHDDETSTPYYYSVKMDKDGNPITGEMTATERCAMYRFTFEKAGADNHILIEASRNTNNGTGTVEIDVENQVVYVSNSNNMSGQDQKLNDKPPKNLKGYYAITFDRPFTVDSIGTYTDYTPVAGNLTTEGKAAGAYLTFATMGANETVEMTIGTSFLSFEQAEQNVVAEIGDKTFDQIKDALKQIWNEKLNLIQIEGATEDEMYIFYTAMFHAMMYPRKFYETDKNGTDKYYSPFDDEVHEGISYTDFSLWDTFRAQNSFLTLVEPENVDAMVTSLLQNFQEGGYMPKWPNPNYTNIMIGTHADSIVAEAINKGLLNPDKYDLAYQAVYKDAMVPQVGESEHMWSDREKNVPYEARGGLGAYKTLGYVPSRYASEDVSRTMEFAYDDWCVAQVAKAMGKTNEYKYFLDRSLNYKNGIDPVSGYAMGRNTNGDFNIDGRFTEGSSQKYTWLALHDPQGLLDLMTKYKGADFYNTELEKAWADKQPGDTNGLLGGWIDQQNEPCHHYAYMFDFSGRPDLTQKYARKTLEDSYFNKTFGMIGNDDCGQMSSWYIFSAMGFYPVNPASGEYMIGSPIFDKVTINNPGGAPFIITAENNDDGANMYIQSATLNGQPLNEPIVTYEQITAGGTMGFVMGSTPSGWAKDYSKPAIVKDGTVTLADMEPDFEAPYMIDSQARFFLDDLMQKEGTTVSVTGYSIPQYEVPTNIFDPISRDVLTDGDYNTGFRSDPLTGNESLTSRPFYITVNWTEPQTVDTAYFASPQVTRGRSITQVDVDVSKNGGETFTPAARGVVVKWTQSGPPDKQIPADVARIAFPKQTGVTSLRLRVTAANLQNNCFDLCELEVFNESGLVQGEDVKVELRCNANKLTGVEIDGKTLATDQYLLSGEGQSNFRSKYNGADPNNILTIKAEAFEGASATQVPITLKFNHGKDVTLNIQENYYRSTLPSILTAAKETGFLDYTIASGLLLQDAMDDAQVVINNSAATDDEYKTAFDALIAAIDCLVPQRWGNRISLTDTGAAGTLNKVYYESVAGNTWGDYPGYKWAQPAQPGTTEVTKAFYSIKFNGIKATIYSGKVKSMGMGGVSIDGGEEIQADFWGDYNTNTAVPIFPVYSTPLLAAGEHTIQVRRLNIATGDANGRNTIGFAYAIIYNPQTALEAAQIDLLDLVNKAKGVNRAAYTPETLTAVDEAFAAANAQLRNGETLQADLESTATNLSNAIDGLEELPEPAGHTVTIAPTVNGTVTASAASAEEGEEIAMAITPAAGYELDVLTVTKTGDNTVTVSVAGNKFNMPDYAVTVSTSFKKTVNENKRADAWINLALRASEITAMGPGQTGGDMGGPEMMIDSNHLMGFTTTKNPTLPYDFTLTWDEPQSFDKIKFFTNNGVKNGPTNITFYTSDDGESWQIAAENMELKWLMDSPKDEPEGILVQLPNELKDVTHLKLQVNAYNSNNSQLSIREIEIYNKAGEVVPFDKDQYVGADAKPFDMMLVMSLVHFTKINDGTRNLVLNTDFELSAERRKMLPTPADEWNQTLTLTPAYLETLAKGDKTFTVTYTGEDDDVITKDIKINWVAGDTPTPSTYILTVVNGTITGSTETTGSYEEDDSVSVTADMPAAGYEFKNWTAMGLTGVDLTADPLVFAMPADDVTLTANYQKTADQTAVEAAQAIVEAGSFTTQQEAANTVDAVKTWLVGAINALDGMSATGVTVNESNVSVTDFTAAVADNVAGNGVDGSFIFTVMLTRNGSSATAEDLTGTITMVPYVAPGQTEPPVFERTTQTFEDAYAVAVTFILTGTGTDKYAVYSAAAGGEALTDPAVSVNGSALTLTFTAKPDVETTYYISATDTAGELTESPRTLITVKPYTAPPAGDDVTGVTLDKINTTLYTNRAPSSVRLTANVTPYNAADKSVSWSSDNEKVATVDENGLVSAVGSGTAVITVTTVDGGYTATCTVTVTTYTEPSYTPPSNTTTETVKNEDGSTTKTVTNKTTGLVTETTTYPDGTMIVATTPKGGESSIKVTVPKGKDSVTITIPTGEMLTSGTVAVIVNEDGSEEVVKTSVATSWGLRITLAEGTTLKLVDNSKDFADMAEDNWAYDAVQFAASRELFQGTGADSFSPTGDMTRAMLVTVLARLDGQDTVGGETWYSKAVAWGVENGITDGTNAEMSITRESLVVMLYRYAKAEPSDVTVLHKFPDADKVSGWAAEAMNWAVANGILTGNGAGELNPGGNASRAEVAAILQRFISL